MRLADGYIMAHVRSKKDYSQRYNISTHCKLSTENAIKMRFCLFPIFSTFVAALVRANTHSNAASLAALAEPGSTVERDLDERGIIAGYVVLNNGQRSRALTKAYPISLTFNLRWEKLYMHIW
jgi:hypothetical protein